MPIQNNAALYAYMQQERRRRIYSFLARAAGASAEKRHDTQQQDDSGQEQSQHQGEPQQPDYPGKKVLEFRIAGLPTFGERLADFEAAIVGAGGEILSQQESNPRDTNYDLTVRLPSGLEFLGAFSTVDIHVNADGKIQGFRMHAKGRESSKNEDLAALLEWIDGTGLPERAGYRTAFYSNARGYWAEDVYVGVGISIYDWLFVDFSREDLN